MSQIPKTLEEVNVRHTIVGPVKKDFEVPSVVTINLAKVQNNFVSSAKDYIEGPGRNDSTLRRLRFLEQLLSTAANEIIPILSKIYSLEGAERHAVVVDVLMELLERIEKEVNFFNPVVQAIAFPIIRRGIEKLVKTIYELLKHKL